MTDSDASASRAQLTAKGAATRDRILEAATELIAEHGVSGMSTEQVREAAGVSGSQLYHYFASKQALIRAVIVRQADEIVRHDSSLAAGALDGFDAFRAWAEAVQERVGARVCDLPLLAAEQSGVDDPSRNELQDGFTRWKRVLRAGLERMQEGGALARTAELDELVDVLLAAVQGGSQLSRLMGHVAPMNAALKAALAYLESFATEAARPRDPWIPRP
jgi:TetR/AcrR family transcriptional repressor of nem operon